jgi:hypothetical protein
MPKDMSNAIFIRAHIGRQRPHGSAVRQIRDGDGFGCRMAQYVGGIIAATSATLATVIGVQ